MSRRLIASTALFAIALSACNTVSSTGGGGGSINAKWVGRSAGEFFAKFAPPLSDSGEGSTTVYNWRGGYNRIKQKGGGTISVSCSAKITVSDSYTIRDITIVADRPGANGPSYCAELLAG